ncbi:mitochondrial ribosomal protein L9 [Lasioglossum baleicum]|uniref:mitochondrial ribosomal protein L9 n=1 Tax=Lasioglossum baleicum TaxID=434251 RepID=UPI003FCE6B9A
MFPYTKIFINHLKTQSATLLSNQFDVLALQTRNTYILKRRYPVPLHKKNQKPPPLKSKYFIYDLVENTVNRKQLSVNLILVENVEGVGVKGQQISMMSDKAYENLLLPKLAVYATPENIEKYLVDLSNKKTNLKGLGILARTKNLLSQFYLRIQMSMHTPWTIEKWHIKTSFRKSGIIVPEDAITMPEREISGPDLSIENKEFYVTVKINGQEDVKVRCKIDHWTANPTEKVSPGAHIWELPNTAIFPEDQPVLDSLPKHRLYKNQNNVEQ